MYLQHSFEYIKQISTKMLVAKSLLSRVALAWWTDNFVCSEKKH